VQILSLDQAAFRAGIVRRTLERLLAEGTGPAKVQVSKRRVGILESDLNTWLLKRRRLPPGGTAEMWPIPVGTTHFDPLPDAPAEPPRQVGATAIARPAAAIAG
jgi:predicted DNA-binding transcriptional regulator AlpA